MLTGTGLLLMSGIETGSSWTHLIPGLLVAGIGIGMINTPLASTAVGVVPVERSGMASGVNSTFRQVGIATGIAALGSLFSHQVTQGVRDGLAGTPAAAQSSGIAEAVTSGQIQAVLAQAPAAVRDQLAAVATSSFVDALNHIIVIGAVIAYVAGAACLVLIRQKDFVPQGPPPAPAGGRGRARRGRRQPIGTLVRRVRVSGARGRAPARGCTPCAARGPSRSSRRPAGAGCPPPRGRRSCARSCG